jgi:hypothetical protein
LAEIWRAASIRGLLAPSLMGHVPVDIAGVEIWKRVVRRVLKDDSPIKSMGNGPIGLKPRYMLIDPLCYYLA